AIFIGGGRALRAIGGLNSALCVCGEFADARYGAGPFAEIAIGHNAQSARSRSRRVVFPSLRASAENKRQENCSSSDEQTQTQHARTPQASAAAKTEAQKGK